MRHEHVRERRDIRHAVQHMGQGEHTFCTIDQQIGSAIDRIQKRADHGHPFSTTRKALAPKGATAFVDLTNARTEAPAPPRNAPTVSINNPRVPSMILPLAKSTMAPTNGIMLSKMLSLRCDTSRCCSRGNWPWAYLSTLSR